jgi:hypothetical protein
MDENDGVVDVVVETHWRKEDPAAAYRSMLGVGMRLS